MMRKFFLVLGILLLFSTINAQFTDKNVMYESKLDYFQIDSITYTPDNTIFYIRLKPQKGEMLTFSGAYTSFSWNLINAQKHTQVFPLISLKNIRENGVLQKKILKSAEIFYIEAKLQNYTAELYYDKLPQSIEKVTLIKAINYVRKNVILTNIILKQQYGKQVNVKSQENMLVFSKDSLSKLPDKAKLNYLSNYLTYSIDRKDYANSMEAIKAGLAAVDSSKSPQLYAQLTLYKANILFYQGNQNQALRAYKSGLYIYEKLGNKYQAAIIYNNIAAVYESKFRIEQALKNYQKSLSLFKNLGDKTNSSQINYKIGNLYYKTKKPDNALKYYNSALNIEEQLNNTEEKMASYNNIGVIYYTKNHFGDALQNYFKSLNLAKKTGQKEQQAVNLNNIGNVKYSEKNYTEALQFYHQSENISTKIKYLKGLAIALHNSANTYFMTGKEDSAKILYEQSLQIAKNIGLKEVSYNSYRGLAELYAKENKCNKSLDLYKKYAEIRFSVSETKLRQINIMQEKYLAAAQNREKLFVQQIKALKQENKITNFQLNRMIHQIKAERLIGKLKLEKQHQKLEIAEGKQRIQKLELAESRKDLKLKQLQLIALGIILFLGIFLLIVLVRMNLVRKRANNELAIKNAKLNQQKKKIAFQRDHIENQRDEISKQKQDITDSIFYARRIQQAVLPPTLFFNEFLPENFIFFKPRDIVSGDFYWINQQGGKIVVAAADCTGHGVPGAFMSMLGISYLNRIAAEMEFNDAASILNRLRELLIETLHQTGKTSETKDGMDISLVLIDYKQKKIHYAGAYNPLYLITQNSGYSSDRQVYAENSILHEWRANKMPIGIHLKETLPFTNHIIPYHSDDMLYLFSDGFSDQFGGKLGRKYLPKYFKELLLKIGERKPQEQALEIQYELENWQGENEQVDDILIIGIKLV